ncbi:hypothetical protein MHB50_05205 [Siminovitchia sp. FSL H7-0308]|uniref:hypothetical protein n=1 Tax=Siminovitchia sp. FSL H7-0308 TaxID=2921432 RepID=UPI0030EBB5D6
MAIIYKAKKGCLNDTRHNLICMENQIGHSENNVMVNAIGHKNVTVNANRRNSQ